MSEKCLIIAEAGVNHNGSIKMALELVDAAAEAGADVVKFQTFKAANVVTARARKADYQAVNTGEVGSQLEMLQNLELSLQAHKQLVDRCFARGIGFMSTAFDLDSLEFISTLNVPAIKIPSGDITYAPMLLRAARLGRPLFVSTGMCNLSDIEAALGVIAFGLIHQGIPTSGAECDKAQWSATGQRALRENVTLMHCVTQYPAPPATANLRAMDTLAAAFGLRVGYSDHTAGITVAIAAAARGAAVIEKHFTLNRSLPGPDHAASLEPAELANLVTAVGEVTQALGSPRKVATDVELGNRVIARRSIVAARPIVRGQTITLDDLAFKRPAEGLSPHATWQVLGRPARRDYELDEALDE